ncbi:hypothetical protein PVK06_026239 [Gossypium arboreum]|uniref:Uncharacterized protein n=1 Tax=Gossypium arboreum TaxID=29729 RepID=A0ABR0NXN4_GOSAR|nr:hypothetical protein PVK06_026239 [Gossypium arboreum]
MDIDGEKTVRRFGGDVTNQKENIGDTGLQGSSMRYSRKPAEWRIENNRGKFEGGGRKQIWKICF